MLYTIYINNIQNLNSCIVQLLFDVSSVRSQVSTLSISLDAMLKIGQNEVWNLHQFGISNLPLLLF